MTSAGDDVGPWMHLDTTGTTQLWDQAPAQRAIDAYQPGDPPITADVIRQNALRTLYLAQIDMLGGSLTEPWSPPPPDSFKEQRLYDDYCLVRELVGDAVHGSLQVAPQPPC